MPNLSEIDLGSALLSTFILVGFIATAFAFIKLTIIGINYLKVNYLKQKEEDKDEKKLKGFKIQKIKRKPKIGIQHIMKLLVDR